MAKRKFELLKKDKKFLKECEKIYNLTILFNKPIVSKFET